MVHRRGPRQDAVEVEEAGADGVREAETGPGAGTARDGTGASAAGSVSGPARAPSVVRAARTPHRRAARPSAVPRVAEDGDAVQPHPTEETTTMADRPTPPNPYDFLPQVPSFTVTSTDVHRRRDAAHAARQRRHGRRRGGPLAPAVLVGLPRGHAGASPSPSTTRTRRRPAASGTGRSRTSPASVTELPSGAGDKDAPQLPEGALQLRNDGGFAGYVGAAPPSGHGPHRYFVVVHAVDTETLDVDADTTPAVLGFNLFFHTLGPGHAGGDLRGGVSPRPSQLAAGPAGAYGGGSATAVVARRAKPTRS